MTRYMAQSCRRRPAGSGTAGSKNGFELVGQDAARQLQGDTQAQPGNQLLVQEPGRLRLGQVDPDEMPAAAEVAEPVESLPAAAQPWKTSKPWE